MTSLFWVAGLLSFIELGCGPCDQIGWFSVIKVSVCLPSDALLQHLPLTWVSLTLDVGYLFKAAPAKCSRCS